MTDQQIKMWDTLAELDGEEVLRVLTDWHGLQILDDGFFGHLVDEGYIEESEKEENEDDNCEIGTYDCCFCPLDGACDRQKTMEAAIRAESFDELCKMFPLCGKECPLYIEGDGECEERWPKWKEERLK